MARKSVATAGIFGFVALVLGAMAAWFGGGWARRRASDPKWRAGAWLRPGSLPFQYGLSDWAWQEATGLGRKRLGLAGFGDQQLAWRRSVEVFGCEDGVDPPNKPEDDEDGGTKTGVSGRRGWGGGRFGW